MISFAKDISPDWVLTFAEGEEKALSVRPGETARGLRVSLGQHADLETVRRAAAEALRTAARLGGGSALLRGGEVYDRLGAEGLAALVQGARLAREGKSAPEIAACGGTPPWGARTRGRR